jgi:putative addiction module component (TIGR02574 family)
MDIAATLNQIKAMPVEDRIDLVQAIWASIDEEQANAGLTEAQKEELVRRVQDLNSHPENVLTWDQIKARILDCP